MLVYKRLVYIPVERVVRFHNRGKRGAMVDLGYGEAYDTPLSFAEVLKSYCKAVDEGYGKFTVVLEE